MTYRQLLAANADFRRLWMGQIVSEIGDWLNNIAVLALAFELAGANRQGLALAAYALSRHLPLFFFGPVAGVVVDRANRRRVMIVADVLRAALAPCFILAGALGKLSVIYVVGAALFSVSAFFNVAKRAAIPNITRSHDELLSANALSASTTAATIAVGSALGGVVATFAGRNAVFVLNAATFLLSAEMIRRIRADTKEDESIASGNLRKEQTILPEANVGQIDKDLMLPLEVVAPVEIVAPEFAATVAAPRRFNSLTGSLRRAGLEFREGLRYVRGSRVLASLFVVAAGWGLGNGVARALYSIFGARLGVQAASGLVARPVDFGISVLFVAMGLGGVLGAPIAVRFNKAGGAGLGARMGRSMVFDGCGLALFSFMPTLWTAALVLTAREANFAIWWTAQQTIVMSRTDDRYRGRVFASYETLTTLMMVGSMLAAGAAADVYGIRFVAATGGIVIALSGLSWFVLERRGRRLDNSRAAGSEKISA
ncbi:MAG: MFS transporter [Pyrinomonadaceae bacterium]